MKYLKTPTKTLEHLANDKDWRVRCRVANNPSTPPETLDRLANDADWDVRYYVALNPNTSPETLERLANDEDYAVRYWVARNPNTPSILKENMKDKREMRRLMTTDPETLDTISFLRWLDCADVDSLESFANRHIVT
jgi:hypothetical protein